MSTQADDGEWQEFLQRLRYADWHYGRSDDPRAYREGRDGIAELQRIANEKGGRWLRSFDDAARRAYDTEGLRWPTPTPRPSTSCGGAM